MDIICIWFGVHIQQGHINFSESIFKAPLIVYTEIQQINRYIINVLLKSVIIHEIDVKLKMSICYEIRFLNCKSTNIRLPYSV